MAPRVHAAVARIGLVDDTLFGNIHTHLLGVERGRDFGAILFALRRSPKTVQALTPLGRSHEKDRHLPRTPRGYALGDRAGRFHLLVPVFDSTGRPILDSATRLSRDIVTRWLVENRPKFRSDLGPCRRCEMVCRSSDFSRESGTSTSAVRRANSSRAA
jgi:hypothetical protein